MIHQKYFLPNFLWKIFFTDHSLKNDSKKVAYRLSGQNVSVWSPRTGDSPTWNNIPLLYGVVEPWLLCVGVSSGWWYNSSFKRQSSKQQLLDFLTLSSSVNHPPFPVSFFFELYKGVKISKGNQILDKKQIKQGILRPSFSVTWKSTVKMILHQKQQK